MTKQQIWKALNRMQKAVMAADSQVTRAEFFAETVEEQRRYYNWMRNQCGVFTAGDYWPED